MKNGNVQEFVDHIHYGDELPADLKQSLDAIMAAMQALIDSGATAS